MIPRRPALVLFLWVFVILSGGVRNGSSVITEAPVLPRPPAFQVYPEGLAIPAVRLRSSVVTNPVWSARNLPPGLTLNRQGVLSGKPRWDKKWGNGNLSPILTFTVTASNARLKLRETETRAVRITRDLTTRVLTTSLPDGKMDVRYFEGLNNSHFEKGVSPAY